MYYNHKAGVIAVVGSRIYNWGSVAPFLNARYMLKLRVCFFSHRYFTYIKMNAHSLLDELGVNCLNHSDTVGQ